MLESYIIKQYQSDIAQFLIKVKVTVGSNSYRGPNTSCQNTLSLSTEHAFI